jgi:hypothetical protein
MPPPPVNARRFFRGPHWVPVTPDVHLSLRDLAIAESGWTFEALRGFEKMNFRQKLQRAIKVEFRYDDQAAKTLAQLCIERWAAGKGGVTELVRRHSRQALAKARPESKVRSSVPTPGLLELRSAPPWPTPKPRIIPGVPSAWRPQP